MPRRKFTLYLPALLLSFHLGYPIFAQSGSAKTGAATVSGRVTLNGEPARRVNVAMQPQRQLPFPHLSVVKNTKTDEYGRFRFTGVAAGSYSIAAQAPGFSSSSDSGFWPRNKGVKVSEGENVEDLEIELKRGGVITGRVTDAQGRPLTDEAVEIAMIDKDGSRHRSNNNINHEMFVIDDRGIYRVYGLPAGAYLVSVGYAPVAGVMTFRADRAFYPRTIHPNVTDESRAKVIEVAEGSEATDVDIVVGIKKTHDIVGRVINADTGQPVVGVELAYGPLMDDGRPLAGFVSKGDRTDAKGEFLLATNYPGKYAISAGGMSESDFYSEPVICDAREGDVQGVEIKVRQGASISGVVVIEGANDPALLSKLSLIRLYAITRSNQLVAPGKGIKVNPDGRFQMRGLQPGKVDISMNKTPALKGLSRLRIEHNGEPQRDGIDLDPGEHAGAVRFVVGYGTGVVRGQVKIIGGELPRDFILMAVAKRADDPESWGESDQIDGRSQFMIEGLTPGEYELQLSVYSAAPMDARISKLEPLITKARERVVVSNGSEARAILIIDLSRKENGQ